MANAHVKDVKEKASGVEAGVPEAEVKDDRQLWPGTPAIKPRVDLRSGDVNVAMAWLAEAYEMERVLGQGDHVSPVTVTELMLEAIPVVQALVDSTSNIDGTKKRTRGEKAEDDDEQPKRERG